MHWSWAVGVLVAALSLLHANVWVALFMRNSLERRQLQPLDEADLLGLPRQDADLDAFMGEVAHHAGAEPAMVTDDGEEESETAIEA